MTIEEIRQIIQIFTESGVAELEVQLGENRLRVRKNAAPQESAAAGATQAAAGASAASASPVAGPAIEVTPQAAAQAVPPPIPGAHPAPDTPAKQQPIVDERHELVRSPIVGTYYDAPAPGAPPFVKVGDQVEPGQVLCIVESMKLMNEIESEIAGTIVAKLVESGRPVEYGEALFAILPR